MFYLFMGFAAVWVFVTGYLVFMGLRQRRIEADLRLLREDLDARAKA